MAYIVIGLFTSILGLLLFFDDSDSPVTMERSELFGLLVLAGGMVTVLIGMVVHVVEVNRADRQRLDASAERASAAPTRDSPR